MKNINTTIVFEDDSVTTFVMNHLLKTHEHFMTSLFFDNSDDGLHHLFNESSSERSNIDLIILDLNLPPTDGWDVLNQLNGHPEFSKVPVAIVTSSISHKDQERAKEYPQVIGFFSKPLSHPILDDILSIISSM